ncbi:hypothetical protein C4D60_Mb11t08410 [Musa balbisiana]|uniref:Sm domain-containing protein n=1 Tax=Musa balbisiana TaxID=52838 RepID=A0A4S8J542_MUSBA|nr:hypothetical protein C4D60_Mb11t08410 [Musa balbisiana]
MSRVRPEDVFSISLASYLDDFYASEIPFLETLWIDLVCHLSCENLVIESRESDCVAWSIFLHLSDKTGNPIVPSFYSILFILLVLLLDGQKITGILRSFDKFASVVVEGACEQVIVGDLYCDIPLGLYVIRGDNVILVGELAWLSHLTVNLTCWFVDGLMPLCLFIYCSKSKRIWKGRIF